MSTEQNKINFRRIPEEIFNQGKLELIDELFSHDYVEHVPLPPGFSPGREGVKQYISLLRSAFPDFHYTIGDQFVEGDKHVGQLTAHGTHLHEFMGIPPTGKTATWTEIHIGRMVEGKLVEHWANQDDLGMLQQLGVIPAMAG
jgi:predicted ester cyclase